MSIFDYLSISSQLFMVFSSVLTVHFAGAMKNIQ